MKTILKNKNKAILSVLLAIIMVFTLASCGKVNTKVPYGTLGDKTYVSNGTYSITEKEIYDQFRKNGYSDFEEMVITKLLSDKYTEVNSNFEDYYYDLVESVKKAVYGTTEEEDIFKLTASTIDKGIKKFVDTLYADGITVTASEVQTILGLSDDLDATAAAAYVDNSILNYYKYDLVKKQYARDILVHEVNLEKVPDEDDTDSDDDTEELIDNPYYIDFDEKIDSYYESHYKEDSKHTAVVIKFSTLRDANYWLDKCYSALGITKISENPIEAYTYIYNNYYSYKQAITANDFTSETTNDNLLYEDAELSALSANLLTDFTDVLENGEYLEIPRYYGSYVLMYKVAEKTNVELTSSLKEEIKETLIDNNLSSTYVTKKISKLIKSAEIEIYDPILAVQFANAYSSYERTEAFENDKVAKITLNGKTSEISVQDFFSQVEKTYGVDCSLDLLIKDYLIATNLLNEIPSEDIDTFKETYNTTIKSFKKNELATYPSDMGIDNFKLLYFGYTNETDIINRYYAIDKIQELFFDQYPDALFTSLAGFTKKAYEEYLKLNINHILIYFDVNQDGNLDDPEILIKEFKALDAKNGTTLETEFKEYVAEIATTIVKEVTYLGQDTTYPVKPSEALLHISKVFKTGGLVEYLNDGTTWDDLKKFGVEVKYETLGDVDYSSVSNYVLPFQARLTALYKGLNSYNFDEFIEFSEDNVADIDVTLEELCTTNYGYHIIAVKSASEALSSKYSADDDPNASYKDISIFVGEDEDEATEEDYVKVSDSYSENKYPSSNQLKVYYYESTTDDGIVSLANNPKKAVAAFFPNVLTRYQNSTFQYWLSIQYLGTIDFTNNDLDSRLVKSEELLTISVDGYDPLNAKFAGWWTAETWTVIE